MTDDDSGRVHIAIADATVEGNLLVPRDPIGVVLFAHGSGSSRFSARNRFVAAALRDRGLATLLVDLLTAEEERVDNVTAELRFDIGMLATRLVRVVVWMRKDQQIAKLNVGLFGASTGGGAALVAAAQKTDEIRAVVSRGGRPDLAAAALRHVEAPTLLIVGGADVPVIGINQGAFDQMRCEKRMEIVPGASHLFEEPGMLDEVARLASEWFVRHLSAPA